MLTRVLVVLLTALLLQPPGYCLCRLGAMALRLAAPAAVTPAASVDEAPRKTCSCCHRSDEGDAREAPQRADEPAPPPDHLPGCPVGPTAAVGRAPAVEPVTLFTGWFTLDTFAVPLTAGPVGGLAHPHHGPPPEATLPLRC